MLESSRAAKNSRALADVEREERNCRVSTFSGLEKISQPDPLFNRI
jgi:hypothetical protein